MSKKTVSFTEEEPQLFEYEQTELPAEEKKTKEQSQERKDWFLNVMSVSMGIRSPEKLLDEVSFEGVGKFIAAGKCSNIITMVGAGISTSAGIPDYRSPGTGLMDSLKDKYPNVKHVSDLFNIQFFLRDPKPFFDRSRRFFEISLKNIDTLDRLAGLPGDKVVEAHGSYYTSHCMLCDRQYSFDWMEEKVLKDGVPTCEEDDCDGVIKPDIVMFGESLSERFGECAEEDTLKCDLLLIMGTALAVQPFASLTSKVKSSTPRLYINLDRGKTGKKHPMTDIMFGGSFDFDCEDNVRDVFKQEKCDEACYQLADQLGWGEELRTLVTAEHARITEEDKIKGKVTAPPLTDVIDTCTTCQDTSQKSTTSSASHDTSPTDTDGVSSSKTTKPSDSKAKTKKAGRAEGPSLTVKASNSNAASKHAAHDHSGESTARSKPTSSSSPSAASGASARKTSTAATANKGKRQVPSGHSTAGKTK